MSAHTLQPVSYNPDEDWLRPILGALLVHLLVVLIFGLAWVWSPTRNTSTAAGEGTLEASLELSGAEMAAAQRALSQSIAQSATTPVQLQPEPPARQALSSPAVEPVQIPETVVPVMVPDTQEQMRVLAEQQRQQQEEAERQRQAELAAEQQRQQQEEAERQRQAELAAEQQRQQQEEAERQRQAELAAEQQRQQAEQLAQQQEQEQQEAERLAKAAELRQRREQLEQQAAEEQQRLARMQNEQRRANQAVAAASNAASASSSAANNAGAANGGSAGAGGDNHELLGRYKAAIQQAVLRQWIRPETIPLGQKCRLTINQIPAGGVSSVQFDPSCPYDQAGRRSVEAAILRASPLPYRGFENVFERTLYFNFEAQDR